MSIPPQIIVLLIGLAAGVFSGLFGVGGGIIIVPALVFTLGYPMQAASGTSLIALLAPIGAMGVYHYWKSGFVQAEHFKIGAIIACGIFVGGYFGARIASQLPSTLLQKIFSFVLIVIAIKLWWSAKS